MVAVFNQMSRIMFCQNVSFAEDISMPLTSHFQELRIRVLISFISFSLCCSFNLIYSTTLFQVIQQPGMEQGIKFLQLSPNEMLSSSIQISQNFSFLVGLPSVTKQLTAWVRPGLYSDERITYSFLIGLSFCLILLGITFSYQYLIPSGLDILAEMGRGQVTSFWSISQYIDFIFFILFGCAVTFQFPIFQFLFGILGLVSSSQMFSVWRLVVFVLFCVSGILTPSVDPISQVLVSVPLSSLYFISAYFVKLFEDLKKL